MGKQVGVFASFASTQPHASFSAFIHGLRHQFTFVMRTIPNISELLKTLDQAIYSFIRVLLNGYTFNNYERALFSLPEIVLIIHNHYEKQVKKRGVSIIDHYFL